MRAKAQLLEHCHQDKPGGGHGERGMFSSQVEDMFEDEGSEDGVQSSSQFKVRTKQHPQL